MEGMTTICSNALKILSFWRWFLTYSPFFVYFVWKVSGSFVELGLAFALIFPRPATRLSGVFSHEYLCR